MTDIALAWLIEETCFNAFPSLKQIVMRGWLLRFSEGLSRRGNSANPLHTGCARPHDVITEIENHYRRHDQPAIVRVPSFMAGTLAEPLALRGYSGDGESCVLHCAIEDIITAAGDPAVELLPRPTAEWLVAMSSLQGHSCGQRGTYRRILWAVAVPAAFAALRIDGRIAALAYGAVHDRLLVYESVITAPSRRRQGLSRRLMAALADWGRNHGAEGACLQVETANTPARTLYNGLGLTTELYRYQYWREPPKAAADSVAFTR